MNRTILILSIIALLTASCAPRPVFRMEPEAENTTFDKGTEYVTLFENGVELTISYYRHLGERFIMDVEIANETDSVLRVDPTQFKYDAYKYYNGFIPDSTVEVMATRRSVNPEHELLKKDMAISRSQADQKTSNVLYAIGQAASVAQSITEEDPEKREELSEERQESAINHDINQHNRRLYRQGLRDQREVWEIDALRKTDLYPGEYIRGYLFFKNEPDASGYMIRYDSETAAVDIFYRQIKYEVH